MQVEVDPKWHGLSGFGDKISFQFWQNFNFPFALWTIVHGSQNIESIGIASKKFMQVHVDVDEICMHNNFGGHA